MSQADLDLKIKKWTALQSRRSAALALQYDGKVHDLTSLYA